jgi:hypothetical protein
MVIEECRDCAGTGKIEKAKCNSCGGRGFLIADKPIREIPDTVLPGKPVEGEVGEMDVAARLRMRRIVDRKKGHLDRIMENMERENQLLALVEDNTSESLNDTYRDAVEMGLLKREGDKEDDKPV